MAIQPTFDSTEDWSPVSPDLGQDTSPQPDLNLPPDYTTVTGQPNPFGQGNPPTTADDWNTDTSFGPLSQTSSGSWTLYDKPVCTFLVQLIIDEGFHNQFGLYGEQNRDRYIVPQFQESGFHLQAHHPEIGTVRLSGQAARVMLEQKGYFQWDPGQLVWQATDLYHNFVQYGVPPAQPVCPDAGGQSGVSPGATASNGQTGQCLIVTIDKGTPSAEKPGGAGSNKYLYTCRSLVVSYHNNCNVPIQLRGTCHWALSPEENGYRDLSFNRDIASNQTRTHINSGVCKSKWVDDIVSCSGTVVASGQTYSWSKSQ